MFCDDCAHISDVCFMFQKDKGKADEHFSGADLWIPFPGNGDALTEFAE